MGGVSLSQDYWKLIFQGLESKTNSQWISKPMPSRKSNFYRHHIGRAEESQGRLQGLSNEVEFSRRIQEDQVINQEGALADVQWFLV